MIKLSVIVPVYNVEKYLRKCLDSIISQTLSDIEIICVNDGSTDGSLCLLREYEKKDNRVIVVDKENGGLSSARNTGIKIARGEYITFLDSDDWVASKNTYENMYNYALNKDLDIVTGQITRFIGGKYVPESYYPAKVAKDKKIYTHQDIDLFSIPSSACNKLYKLSLLKDNNIFFDEGLKYSEAIPFFFEVFLKAKLISHTDDIVFYYRITAPTEHKRITNSKSDDFLYGNISAYSKVRNILENRNELDRYRYQLFLKNKIQINRINCKLHNSNDAYLFYRNFMLNYSRVCLGEFRCIDKIYFTILEMSHNIFLYKILEFVFLFKWKYYLKRLVNKFIDNLR